MAPIGSENVNHANDAIRAPQKYLFITPATLRETYPADVPPTEVNASHAGFISQPATIAQVIETAANQTNRSLIVSIGNLAGCAPACLDAARALGKI